MKLIKIKTQKFYLIIPYLGLFIIALFQTINLTKIIGFKKAWKYLFKTLVIMYFIVSCIYSLLIHPLIYMENNLTLTYILVILITYFLHVIMGYILLYLQTNKIKIINSDKDFKVFRKS